VLDRETGLVWQASLFTGSASFTNAHAFCAHLAVGGRGGWRLPTQQEVLRTTAVATDSSGSQGVITDSPFAFLSRPFTLWTATRSTDDATRAFVVVGNPPQQLYSMRYVAILPGDSAAVWCVQSPAAGGGYQ